MSSFRNILHLCSSKTEKEAVSTDHTPPYRPTTPRNEAAGKSDSATKNVDSRNTSPGPFSSIESSSREANTSESETEHLPLRFNKSSSPANLGNNFFKGFEPADPHVIHDKSTKLTGTGAPGSHSALFGLTPDGHKESKATYGSLIPKPAYGAEGDAALSGDEPAALVTIAPVRVDIGVHGTLTVGDTSLDSELLAGWAVANTSVVRDEISSGRTSINAEVGTDGCDGNQRTE